MVGDLMMMTQMVCQGSTGGSKDEADGLGGSDRGSDGFWAGVDGILCSGELSAKICLFEPGGSLLV